jgi:hypothetical protein
VYSHQVVAMLYIMGCLYTATSLSQKCSKHSSRSRGPGDRTGERRVQTVGVANLNDVNINLITMKKFLVKAAELGSPKIGAEACVYIHLLNPKIRYQVGGSLRTS